MVRSGRGEREHVSNNRAQNKVFRDAAQGLAKAQKERLRRDEWTITWKGKQIADSDSVNLDLVNGLVWKYFFDKQLNGIHFTNKPKQCTIFFGGQGVIAGEVVIQLRGEADEDMCTITFPDGTIIVCNAKDGFVSDGSRSDVHVAAYASD